MAVAIETPAALRREPWGRFLAKAVLVTAALYAVGAGFAARYKIGISSQVNSCIPGVHFFLIDTHDLTPERGAIFAFKAKGVVPWLEDAREEAKPLIPYFADGKTLVKYMSGVPGDAIHVSATGVDVNGENIASGLVLADTLNKAAADLVREIKLGAGEYWFSGTAHDSFDSRYWGTVAIEQLVGRAYALF